MRVIKLGLSALVSKQEYMDNVGSDVQSLYVVDENYNFYKRSNLAEGGSCLLNIAVQELPKMEKVEGSIEETISFLPGGKIPGEMLNQIVSFFRKVMDINFGGARGGAGENAEAMAHILWNKEDKCYQVGIPTQIVSKASVNYEFDDVDQMKHVIIIDIHSHNTMSSFFSGTDDNDDKKGCWFAGVVGNLDKKTPTLNWRFTNYGNFRKVRMEDLFDIQGEVQSNLEVPAEWMAKVKGRYEAPKGGHLQQVQRGQQGSMNFGNMAHLYRDRQRTPAGTWQGHMAGSDQEDDWRQAFEDYENRQRHVFNKEQGWRKTPSSRSQGDDDYSTRVLLDVTDGIEELSFPIHSQEMRKIAECLRDQVNAGISRLHKKDARFYLVLAEYFIEAFSEEHEAGDVGTRTNAAYIIESILEHADWDVLTSVHEALMEKIQTYYEEGSDINLLIDYMEEQEEELLPDQVHRLRELIENAEVRSDETSH